MTKAFFGARRHHSILLVLALGSLGILYPTSASAQCGQERWSVKTGTDTGSGQVDLTAPTPTTIANLRGFSAPHPIPRSKRVAPAETTFWEVNATLDVYALESDSDYHLVLVDDARNSIIAEIPDPGCVHGTSPFSQGITNARAEFDAQFTASSSFQSANIPVRVRGVGMFDFFHNQRGFASNGIELHPVLDIVFNPGSTSTGDFSISIASPTIAVGHGGNGTVTVTTQGSDDFNSPVALALNGLPPGGTASFDPAQIPPPGTGSSTLTVSVGTATPSGNYNLKLTGSAGNLSHSAGLSLTVSSLGPSASVSAPTAGSTVSGVVNITATGGTGVAKMEIYIDGVLKAWDIAASSVIYPWDTTAMSNGSHTIQAKAYDAAGNVGTSSTVAVTIAN